jgi:hypothetical protein
MKISHHKRRQKSVNAYVAAEFEIFATEPYRGAKALVALLATGAGSHGVHHFTFHCTAMQLSNCSLAILSSASPSVLYLYASFQSDVRPVSLPDQNCLSVLRHIIVNMVSPSLGEHKASKGSGSICMLPLCESAPALHSSACDRPIQLPQFRASSLRKPVQRLDKFLVQ